MKMKEEEEDKDIPESFKKAIKNEKEALEETIKTIKNEQKKKDNAQKKKTYIPLNKSLGIGKMTPSETNRKTSGVSIVLVPPGDLMIG